MGEAEHYYRQGMVFHVFPQEVPEKANRAMAALVNGYNYCYYRQIVLLSRKRLVKRHVSGVEKQESYIVVACLYSTHI
jgi:hypothetical protein